MELSFNHLRSSSAPEHLSNLFIVNFPGGGIGGSGTYNVGGGINGNGGVKPNLDQLISLPGLDNDYNDDYLKGGGSNSSGGLNGMKGSGSPVTGFAAGKTSFKL